MVLSGFLISLRYLTYLNKSSLYSSSLSRLFINSWISFCFFSFLYFFLLFLLISFFILVSLFVGFFSELFSDFFPNLLGDFSELLSKFGFFSELSSILLSIKFQLLPFSVNLIRSIPLCFIYSIIPFSASTFKFLYTVSAFSKNIGSSFKIKFLDTK